MFIPLRDENPSGKFPFVNVCLILANIAVFIYQLTLTPHAFQIFVTANAMVPARIPAVLNGYGSFEAAFLPLVTSMFLHAGIAHILGNMLFLGIFGSLALVVASLGIVNTLVMAILERRREIGIMKALGASDGDVKKIFFVEACSMGVLGGALGVGMGWLIGRVINFGTNLYLQRQLEAKPQEFWYVPLWLVLGAVGFSVLVSLFAGLYPASRAAKLDPVQALRHE